MATLRIEPLRLNFRSTPSSSEKNLIGELPLGQEVEVVDAVGSFSEVKTRFEGGVAQGFVSSRFLRPVESEAKEALLAEAVKEWLRFEKGEGKEFEDPFFRFVGEMWQALDEDLDGRDREWPWSAAYISFIMSNASAYPDFKFSIRHADYIVDAITKREANASAPFWGFRLSEHKPKLGDLVCEWREVPTTFNNAVAKARFPSHCDVVVRVRPRWVETLGGNVGQSVGRKTTSLNNSGFLKAKDTLFAVLRNNE